MDGSQSFETDHELTDEPARAATPVANARPKSTPLGVIVSASAGFVAGAFFWHLLGFWSFVNEAVFYKRTENAGNVMRSAQAKSQNRQAGVAGPVVAVIGTCTLATLDRTAGEVKVAACDGPATKYKPSRGIQRADLADFGPTPVPTLISSTTPKPDPAAVGGWSARVEKLDTAPVAGANPVPDKR